MSPTPKESHLQRRTLTEWQASPPTTGPDLEELSVHFKRAYDTLYKQALSVVHSPESAHDIVQDAYTETAARIKDGTKVKNMTAWLQTVVRNRCRNRFSKRRKSYKTWLPLEEDLYLASSETPVELAHVRKRCADIQRAVDQLAPHQRTVFLLAELRGLEYREIADTLGRTEHSVRQLLARARKQIRAVVGPDAVPVAIPLVQQESEVGSTLEGGLRSLREYLATKLSNMHAAASSFVQRSVDLVHQPAAALFVGALVVGALSATVAQEEPGTPIESTPATASVSSPLPSFTKTAASSADPAMGGRPPRRASTSTGGNQPATPGLEENEGSSSDLRTDPGNDHSAGPASKTKVVATPETSGESSDHVEGEKESSDPESPAVSAPESDCDVPKGLCATQGGGSGDLSQPQPGGSLLDIGGAEAGGSSIVNMNAPSHVETTQPGASATEVLQPGSHPEPGGEEASLKPPSTATGRSESPPRTHPLNSE